MLDRHGALLLVRSLSCGDRRWRARWGRWSSTASAISSPSAAAGSRSSTGPTSWRWAAPSPSRCSTPGSRASASGAISSASARRWASSTTPTWSPCTARHSAPTAGRASSWRCTSVTSGTTSTPPDRCRRWNCSTSASAWPSPCTSPIAAACCTANVKPHNIFRSVYGDPALGDFGISTLAGERSHDRSTALSLAYVAPEILDDAPPSAQADVYSLAATLHHLATGRAPFDGREPSRVVNQVLHADPPPLDRPDLPPSFERTLRMAMAKDPAKRPMDARAFAEMLREVQARAGHPATTLKLDTDESRPFTSPMPDDPVATTGAREGRQPRPEPAGVVERSASPPAGSQPVGPVVALGAPDDRRPRAEPAGPRPSARSSPDAPSVDAPSAGTSSNAAAVPVTPDAGHGVPFAGQTAAPRFDAESTIARRPPAVAVAPPPEPGPSRRRVVVASVLAVVAVAAVIVAIAIAGGGDPPATTTATTVVTSRPPDTFFTPLAMPAGVTVVTAGDGTFTVSVPPVAGARSYEIEPANGGEPVTVAADQLPATVDGQGASTLCVTVRALGSEGRVSRDAGPFCSP
ncbi:MAG: protein kinase [Ilumatobacteraceae bacterium]